jgi:hypothetical protein
MKRSFTSCVSSPFPLPRTFPDAFSHAQENIPFIPSSDHSLPLFLASSLPSQPQNLILPPLFDRENPPTSDDEDDDADAAPSQAAMFAASKELAGEEGEKKTKRPRVPKGGGPFKGFAFVVCRDREEAEKVVEEWKWEGGSGAAGEGEHEQQEEEEGEDEKMVEAEESREGAEVAGEKKSGKGKKRKLTPLERAKMGGLRALS